MKNVAVNELTAKGNVSAREASAVKGGSRKQAFELTEFTIKAE